MPHCGCRIACPDLVRGMNWGRSCYHTLPQPCRPNCNEGDRAAGDRKAPVLGWGGHRWVYRD